MEDYFYLFLAFTITSADIFVNVANIIYTVGSAVKNAFYLRIAIVFGGIFEILYYAFIVESPLWTPMIWALLLISVNVYFIIIVYYEKYKINLNADELKIYNNLFSKMDKLMFQRFIKMATIKEYEPQKDIIVEGKPSDKLYLMFNGVAEVQVNKSTVAYVHNGAFIGEMSFLTGDLPTATVRTMVPSRIYSWDKLDVKKLSDKISGFKSELQEILSGDLILKITRQNKKDATKK